ncbi:MAG: RNA polymerase sigma factor [Lachnospiraceae bacterium]|nr:RNA polymerase sigma factor [Lachnospiraceae bacterium]
MNAREIETCIDHFGTDIYRFCLKLCADKTDAEDLYQQTFLKALETEWTLDWENNPKALFFSLAHNLWKSDRRKQARRNTIAPCSNLNEETEMVLHSEENIEESYLQKELITEVRQIIQTLPEKFQVPLILYYLSDCPIEQIAAIIKKPPGTVKSRLFKGRNLIKKRLEDAGYERSPF